MTDKCVILHVKLLIVFMTRFCLFEAFRQQLSVANSWWLQLKLVAFFLASVEAIRNFQSHQECWSQEEFYRQISIFAHSLLEYGISSRPGQKNSTFRLFSRKNWARNAVEQRDFNRAIKRNSWSGLFPYFALDCVKWVTFSKVQSYFFDMTNTTITCFW